MTAIGPGSLLPIGVAARPDANAEAVQAAKFENALAQAPSSSTAAANPPQPEAGEQSSSAKLAIDTNALTAADDAWVRFLAVSEQLQNPLLPTAVKDSLLKDLTANWRSFRSQSEPIIRQLDDYVASRDAVPSGEPRIP